jgi:hypothetical protein
VVMEAYKIGKWRDRDCGIAVVKAQKSTRSCARKAVGARMAAMAKDGCALTKEVSGAFTAKIPLPPGGAGGVGDPAPAMLACEPSSQSCTSPYVQAGHCNRLQQSNCYCRPGSRHMYGGGSQLLWGAGRSSSLSHDPRTAPLSH